MIALYEWYGYLTHSPRRAKLFTAGAAVALLYAGWRFFVIRRKVRSLKQGTDGERAVGQFLERLRADGAQVFHDIPGERFNLGHVVISTHGIYAIETKTWSKPWAESKVVVEGDALTEAGQAPVRNPICSSQRCGEVAREEIAGIHAKELFRSGRRHFSGMVCGAGGPQGEMCGYWGLKCCPALSGKRRRRLRLLMSP